MTSGGLGSHESLARFFRLECFMPGEDNFCPTGSDVSGGDTNPLKFTSLTLLGSIYHTDRYSGGMRTECKHTEAAIQASSFGAAESGGVPTKFILDTYGLLTCGGKVRDASDMGDGTVTQAYSTAADQHYQATLTGAVDGQRCTGQWHHRSRAELPQDPDALSVAP